MRNATLLLLFATLTLAFACNKKVTGAATADNMATAATKTITFGGQENLAIGETLGVEKSKTTLKFVELVNDNRCPKNVNCIQAGEATVLVSLNGGAPQRVVLEAGARKVATLAATDGVFRFTALTPYPEDRVEIQPAQRRLRVELMAAKQMRK